SFQHYGKTKIGDWIDENIDQAKHLHKLALSENVFESAAEPIMSAICIHYKASGLNNEQLTKLHRDVAAQIEREGKFWFATTELKGKTYFRINPVNINTKIQHIDALYQLLKEACHVAEEKMKLQLT
ncbi:MAG TPA: hypothetical protein VNA26_02590, partial [Chitinophagaceae bacterium]|nr:hypothetical protein [Chitinophagaceae bacterium]